MTLRPELAHESAQVVGDAPALTVVIPTHGRAHLVAEMLLSLQEASSRLDAPVEVLVVDSSTPRDAKLLSEKCLTHNARLIIGPLSVRAKRNIGLNQARASIVLFIDSDCHADTELFAEHLKAWTAAPDKTAAITGLTQFVGGENWVWRIVSRTTFLDAFGFAARYPFVQWAITNNLSCRKDIVRELGGFEEYLPYRLGWDDIDLGLRLTRAGYLIQSAPAAVVYHEKETWSSLWGILSRIWRWGRLRYHILGRHPWLKRHDPPKQSVLWIIGSVLLIITAMRASQWWPLLLILLWTPITCLIVASIRTLAWGLRLRVLPAEWAAELILSLHDFATQFEALRHGSATWLYQRLIFSDPQVESDYRVEVERSWAYMITFTAIFSAVVLLQG